MLDKIIKMFLLLIWNISFLIFENYILRFIYFILNSYFFYYELLL